jgi:hypothetical protein
MVHAGLFQRTKPIESFSKTNYLRFATRRHSIAFSEAYESPMGRATLTLQDEAGSAFAVKNSSKSIAD